MSEHGGAVVDGGGADQLARKTFYVTLIGCLAFALAVFLFVLR